MSIKRFIFNIIASLLFCSTVIFGPVLIDAIVVGLLIIAELIVILLLFVPFSGTFLFRITGIEGLADGEYIDVFLADGWLHKLITFVILNAIIGGIASLIFSIPAGIKDILCLTLLLFIITIAIKIDNAKSDYSDAQALFSDFIPTILGLGIGCYAIFYFTTAPTVIGVIICCLASAVYIARNILALARW